LPGVPLQNMFQEGLYQVYMKDPPSTRPLDLATNQGELGEVRIHRWFGAVVNTRLLVTGVVQLLSALVCILTTVTHACVSYNCSASKITLVWSSLLYVATGCLAMDVQRKPNKMKVNAVCNYFLFDLFFLCHLWPLLILHLLWWQRAGSYVAKGSSIALTVLCLLASIYILFLSWRGLRRYSSPHVQTYSRLSQVNDNAELLLEEEQFSL
uniref:Si:dkey-30c15.13 n=1 Tax=Myripristis murdjan TaxID=586833 RepID=A0A667ZHQ5_9TELE